MSLSMTGIVGNEKLRKRLCDDILAGTFSHAYILSGPAGSGKRTIAMMCAAALACENKGISGYALPCCSCPSCRKILENKSPDILVTEKDGASVKIEQIRELQQSVSIVPNELDHKIYIIENAETMTLQAQNALLLTLEEPPSYVIFFLLCESEEKLLETIKSRAPILRTEPIRGEQIRKFLIENSDDAKKLAESKSSELDSIISISNGSIGRAIELIDEKTRLPFVQRREAAELFVNYALSKKSLRLTELLVSLPHKQDELIPILTYAQTALRDLCLLKQSEDAELCFYSDREAAVEKAYSIGLTSIMALYDKVEKTKDTLLRNANIKLTLVNLIASIVS